MGIGALCNLEHRGATGAEPTPATARASSSRCPTASCGPWPASSCPAPGHYAVGIASCRPATRRPPRPAAASRRSSPSEGLGCSAGATCPPTPTDLGATARSASCHVPQLFVADGPGGARGASTSTAGLRGAQAHRARTARRPAASTSRQPVEPHLVYKGMLTTPQLGEFFPDLLDERSRAPRAGALPVLDQHLPVVAAGAPVPVHRPQRRDQHRAGQPQLDAGPRGAAGQRPVPRRPRALFPICTPAAATPPASTRCSSCCTWAGYRCPTPC
jgi:hypothetical protein